MHVKCLQICTLCDYLYLHIFNILNHLMLLEYAAKNLLSGIPENIGSLSCLIHLDLHQNSELIWKEIY